MAKDSLKIIVDYVNPTIVLDLIDPTLINNEHKKPTIILTHYENPAIIFQKIQYDGDDILRYTYWDDGATIWDNGLTIWS